MRGAASTNENDRSCQTDSQTRPSQPVSILEIRRRRAVTDQRRFVDEDGLGQLRPMPDPPHGSMNALIPVLVHHPPAGLDQSETGEDQMHPRFAGRSEPGPHMAGERGEPAQQHPEEHGTSCRRSRDRRENGNKGAPEQREPTRHGEAEHDHQARKPGTKRSYPEGQAGSGTPADRRCFQRNQPPAAIMRRHPYWAKVNPK